MQLLVSLFFVTVWYCFFFFFLNSPGAILYKEKWKVPLQSPTLLNWKKSKLEWIYMPLKAGILNLVLIVSILRNSRIILWLKILYLIIFIECGEHRLSRLMCCLFNRELLLLVSPPWGMYLELFFRAVSANEGQFKAIFFKIAAQPCLTSNSKTYARQEGVARG